MHASNITFYQYEGRALDHGWLHNCAGFHALRHGASDRFIQEQGLTHSLRHSAHRVRDPGRAQLFYVPIWTVTSAVVGACNGTTHAGRMVAARDALLASPWWRRFYGRDHVWSNGRPQHVDRDLGAARDVAGCTSVARHKSFSFGSKRFYPSMGAACAIETPIQATLAAMASYGKATGGPLVHFAGGLDVCCTGQHIRCAVGKLVILARNEKDVVLRPSVSPNNETWGPCTRSAMFGLAAARRTDAAAAAAAAEGAYFDSAEEARNWKAPHQNSQAAAASGRRLAAAEEEAEEEDDAPADDGPAQNVHGGVVSASLQEATTREMASATFCLVPAGDSYVSGRFYTVIAAGCLPVVLGPHPQAYSGRVDFASFVVHLSDRAFLRDPMSAVRALRAISADEIARRKAALALHRADVLYDLRDSRAGDHFLAEVAEHCLPNLLPELAAENGWNRTALPAAPRLPASCGRAAALARKLATS